MCVVRKMGPCVICLLCFLARVSTEKEPSDPDIVASVLKQNYSLFSGNTTSIEKHPYAVVIYVIDVDSAVWAGAIVGDQWILTTASNVFLFETSDINIRAGSSHSKYGGQLYEIEEIIIHEQFDGKYDYNLALLKTKKKIRFGLAVNPIGLSDMWLHAGLSVIISGWGSVTIYDTPQTTNIMRQGDMSVYDLTLCQDMLKHEPVTARNLCATSYNLGTCRFYSGAPLVYKDKLIGLFLGNPTCVAKEPSVFVNISGLRHWVESRIKKIT